VSVTKPANAVTCRVNPTLDFFYCHQIARPGRRCDGLREWRGSAAMWVSPATLWAVALGGRIGALWIASGWRPTAPDGQREPSIATSIAMSRRSLVGGFQTFPKVLVPSQNMDRVRQRLEQGKGA
jgi:hypothetical protein